ncbi:DUF1684 domain-containing protein [Lacibacter sp.]|uniref:DUF1684 domain-containing protein n=1 Tax=Lacibacter sp. TaxID=1915409 RepID=UPI002B4B4B07|nr:DUF1684 domain-containing protein [Lacibacter sp.]HLP36507.1 DUF1684 domain-containing protein [Lacibacter sp.]
MKLCLLFLVSLPSFASAQTSYEDSLNLFLKKYVADHEVVTGADKQKMKFYPVQQQYRITAVFERKENSPWFLMSTSGNTKQQYRVYGIIRFNIHDTAVALHIYQSRSLMSSEKYKEHLFIPFTDLTSGRETYGGGRYIDLTISDISNNTYVIDFNKAYNPYCAYTTGYNCPIPPKENDLAVAIKAGEMNYIK